AAWSDAGMVALHNYWAAQISIPVVQRATVFDGGGYDGTNVTGFNLGNALIKGASGRWHAFWSSAPKDPDAFIVKYSYSDDAGVTWSVPRNIHTPNAGDDASVLGNSATQLASGRLVLYTSTAP